MTDVAAGQCLCGAVRFRVTSGPLRGVSICHCGQCRRWHGHVGAYTNVKDADLVFDEHRGLAWFQSSDFARRGFCRECGSSLFWQRNREDIISITAGSLDAPTGLSTSIQIFTEDRGDYYPFDTSIPVRPKV